MAKEKFVLVNLQEEKTKKLASVLSNPSCTKILEHLADKEHATESQIAQDLAIPISTVHYNLQQLVAGGLVVVDEFHYSAKGKEVNHYKLANQYIIIAPKSTYGIKEKLKGLFAVGVLAAGVGLLIDWYSTMTQSGFMQQRVLDTVNSIASTPAADAAPSVISEGGSIAAKVAAPSIEPAFQNAASVTINSVDPALWFAYGAGFILVVMLIIELIRYIRSK